MNGGSPTLMPIYLLDHPQNPRLVVREDVVAHIEQQIRANDYDPSHTITVRHDARELARGMMQRIAVQTVNGVVPDVHVRNRDKVSE
jgi:hypothetical protein